MKQLFTSLLLVCTMHTIAQKNFKTVFSAGIDPKMATVGAHPDRPDNTPSLDAEFSFGFEWQHSRILMQIKTHKEVNFLKWTYIQADYKQQLFKNLYAYGGLEISQIKKHHPDFSYDQPDNYREYTINPLQFGANVELQYKLLNEKLGIAVQASIYQSEDELKPYKKFRKEVTTTLFFYL